MTYLRTSLESWSADPVVARGCGVRERLLVMVDKHLMVMVLVVVDEEAEEVKPMKLSGLTTRIAVSKRFPCPKKRLLMIKFHPVREIIRV